nr:MAG TPA: hypothetical protein [Caudoviricetes sp.]
MGFYFLPIFRCALRGATREIHTQSKYNGGAY